jgi:hypothetical protein
MYDAGAVIQSTNVMSTAAGSSKHPFVVILNAAQARSIYLLRSPASAAPEMQSVAGKSTIVAELYRVSPKTIRDIWNRKTWTQVCGLKTTKPILGIMMNDTLVLRIKILHLPPWAFLILNISIRQFCMQASHGELSRAISGCRLPRRIDFWQIFSYTPNASGNTSNMDARGSGAAYPRAYDTGGAHQSARGRDKAPEWDEGKEGRWEVVGSG